MKYTIIEPPEDRYSDSSLRVWEDHLNMLEQKLRDDPKDEGVQSALYGARRTVERLRRREVSPSS